MSCRGPGGVAVTKHEIKQSQNDAAMMQLIRPKSEGTDPSRKEHAKKATREFSGLQSPETSSDKLHVHEKASGVLNNHCRIHVLLLEVGGHGTERQRKVRDVRDSVVEGAQWQSNA
jgi:hypothetical protein